MKERRMNLSDRQMTCGRFKIKNEKKKESTVMRTKSKTMKDEGGS